MLIIILLLLLFLMIAFPQRKAKQLVVVHLLNPVVGCQRHIIHCQQIFGIVIFDCLQRNGLTLQSLLVQHRLGNLIILLPLCTYSNKVNLCQRA